MVIRKLIAPLAVLCAAALLAPLAGAQYLSLDRQRTENEFGFRLDFGFPKVDGEMTADETYFRTEIYGQVVFGEGGGYLNIPISRNIVSVGPRDEVTTFGNLELGGFYTLTRPLRPWELRWDFLDLAVSRGSMKIRASACAHCAN